MGKKGKKGKKGNKAPVVLLAEVEREMFQLQINDLTRKVERITAQCVELENSNEDFEKMYKKLDEDRADIITHLKRTLQEKSDEAKQLQETVDQLTTERADAQEKFDAKIAQMEHEFKIMQEQLSGNAKLLTGRLKALEHFRVHQDELMNKFKRQEQEIEEREKEHKRMLYEVEKKFIIAKDKAMRDMEARQLQLSSEFEATTQMSIAASTKRAIRENIAVNNELNKLVDVTSRVLKENEALKEHERHLKVQNELYEEEKNIVIEENIEHLKVIEHLTLQHAKMKDQIGQLAYASRRLPEVEEQVQQIQSELLATKQQLQIQRQQLHSSHALEDELRHQIDDAQIWGSTLEAVLDTAAVEIKNAIMGAFPHDKSTLTMEEKNNLLEQRDTLLNSLLDLIRGNTMQFSKLTPKKHLKNIACSAIYIPGSFGYIGKLPSEYVDETVDVAVEKSELGLKDSKSLALQKKESLATEEEDESVETAAGMDDEEPKSAKEEHVEVEPIELKGRSVIREGSIITHSSSFMQEISSAMIKHTESEEFEETEEVSNEQIKSPEVSHEEPEISIESEVPTTDSGSQPEAVEVSEVPNSVKEKSRVKFNEKSEEDGEAQEKPLET